MIQAYWQLLNDKVNALSMRERVLIFATLAILLASIFDTFLLTPLLAKQKIMTAQIVQQQEKIKEFQSLINILVESRSNASTSPQYLHLQDMKREMHEIEFGLQDREKLVHPEKMAELLRQMLSRNGNLQLISFETLPVVPLVEDEEPDAEAGGSKTSSKEMAAQPEADKRLYKHGVKLTVRGNYLDLMQYLKSIERLPSQMIWNQATLEVGKYPAADLTLTLYTLSLDKTWLQI